MNILVESILAATLTIIAPGMSTFSQTPIKYCDEACAATPLCENYQDFRCKPPTLNMSLYAHQQARLVREGMSAEDAIEKALPLSYSRPETYEEGLARYYVISSQIVKVAQDNSYGYCLEANKCSGQTTEHTGPGSYQACHKSCYDESDWKNKRYEQLAWALFTVSTFESGWRADVQGGTGWAGRGDCQWSRKVQRADGTVAQQKVRAWTEGAFPVTSTCRSFGLTQVMFGNPPQVMHAWNASYTYDQVLGLDAASTYASLHLATRFLSMSSRACAGVDTGWVWGMFSMYGSGRGCHTESSKSRAARYEKFSYAPNQKGLSGAHKETLAKPEVQELISYMMNSPTKILWLPPVEAHVKASPMEVAQK